MSKKSKKQTIKTTLKMGIAGKCRKKEKSAFSVSLLLYSHSVWCSRKEEKIHIVLIQKSPLQLFKMSFSSCLLQKKNSYILFLCAEWRETPQWGHSSIVGPGKLNANPTSVTLGKPECGKPYLIFHPSKVYLEKGVENK